VNLPLTLTQVRAGRQAGGWWLQARSLGCKPGVGGRWYKFYRVAAHLWERAMEEP